MPLFIVPSEYRPFLAIGFFMLLLAAYLYLFVYRPRAYAKQRLLVAEDDTFQKIRLSLGKTVSLGDKDDKLIIHLGKLPFTYTQTNGKSVFVFEEKKSQLHIMDPGTTKFPECIREDDHGSHSLVLTPEQEETVNTFYQQVSPLARESFSERIAATT